MEFPVKKKNCFPSPTEVFPMLSKFAGKNRMSVQRGLKMFFYWIIYKTIFFFKENKQNRGRARKRKSKGQHSCCSLETRKHKMGHPALAVKSDGVRKTNYLKLKLECDFYL